jgi:hypothetical protein
MTSSKLQRNRNGRDRFSARLLKWTIFQKFLVHAAHLAHAAITSFPDSCHHGWMIKQPNFDFIGKNEQPRTQLKALAACLPGSPGTPCTGDAVIVANSLSGCENQRARRTECDGYENPMRNILKCPKWR